MSGNWWFWKAVAEGDPVATTILIVSLVFLGLCILGTIGLGVHMCCQHLSFKRRRMEAIRRRT